MVKAEALSGEIEAIRASGVLGRSEQTQKLFDFLAQSTVEERSPKEVEVAIAVFGRDGAFDANRDAVVRVYVHKLRRRLETVYAGPRSDAPYRLVIPRGEYRLVAEANAAEAEAAGPATSVLARALPPRLSLAAAALALVLAGGVAAVGLAALFPAFTRPLTETFHPKPVWSSLAGDRLPTLVVLGDYYIFGDSEDGVSVDRLVREYTVNSREQLNAFVGEHPDKAKHYVNLDLRYLPVGSAYALHSVLPMLGEGRSQIVLASDVTSDMLKSNNIVYLGYFSGLGELRNSVLAASRFSIGDTYDEIVDHRTHTTYFSEGGGPGREGAVYRDYGYFSSFKGPSGNRFVVIIGTRDVALMQTAEAATSPKGLKEAQHRAGGGDAFETLYEVTGLNQQNMAGRLLVASPMDNAAIWNGKGEQQRFPAG
jgi:hypothetical protein